MSQSPFIAIPLISNIKWQKRPKKMWGMNDTDSCGISQVV